MNTRGWKILAGFALIATGIVFLGIGLIYHRSFGGVAAFTISWGGVLLWMTRQQPQQSLSTD